MHRLQEALSKRRKIWQSLISYNKFQRDIPSLFVLQLVILSYFQSFELGIREQFKLNVLIKIISMTANEIIHEVEFSYEQT